MDDETFAVAMRAAIDELNTLFKYAYDRRLKVELDGRIDHEFDCDGDAKAVGAPQYRVRVYREF